MKVRDSWVPFTSLDLTLRRSLAGKFVYQCIFKERSKFFDKFSKVVEFLRYMRNFAAWLRNNRYPDVPKNPVAQAFLKKIVRTKTSRKSNKRQSGDLDKDGNEAGRRQKSRTEQDEESLVERSDVVDALRTLNLHQDSVKVCRPTS